MKNFYLLLQVYLGDFYLPHLILILNPLGLAHVMHPVFQPRVSPPVTATANVFCQDLPYLQIPSLPLSTNILPSQSSLHL